MEFSIVTARGAKAHLVTQGAYAGEDNAKKEAWRLATYLYHSTPGTFYMNLIEALKETDKGEGYHLTLEEHLKQVEENIGLRFCGECGRAR